MGARWTPRSRKLDAAHEASKARQIDELKQAIHDNGGDRLERLAAEIARRNSYGIRAEPRPAATTQLATVLGEPLAADAAAFAAQRGKYQSWREEARQRDADLQNAAHRARRGACARAGRSTSSKATKSTASSVAAATSTISKSRFVLRCVRRWAWTWTTCPSPAS